MNPTQLFNDLNAFKEKTKVQKKYGATIYESILAFIFINLIQIIAKKHETCRMFVNFLLE